jgi:hypothetical protein
MIMGLFDNGSDEDIILENADLNCEPQNAYVSKKRVKEIDEYLEPGEKVHFFATDAGGQLKIDGEKEDNAMGVKTAVTNKRVLFKTDKMIGGSQTSIDYRDISSVEVSFGMVQKRLNLETDSKVFGIGVGQIEKDEVQDMARFIRDKMRDEHQKDSSYTTGEGGSEDDPLDKLERLGKLRDDGVITEAEFEEKKQSLLDQI